MPLEYVPTAVNCCVLPFDKLGVGFGVTAIELNTGVPVNVVVVFDEEQAAIPIISTNEAKIVKQ